MKQQTRADKIKLLNGLANGTKSIHDLVDNDSKPCLVVFRTEEDEPGIYVSHQPYKTGTNDVRRFTTQEIDKISRSNKYRQVIKVSFVHEDTPHHAA